MSEVSPDNNTETCKYFEWIKYVAPCESIENDTIPEVYSMKIYVHTITKLETIHKQKFSNPTKELPVS